MNDPEAEIAHVVRLLTQSTPSTQLATLNKYFTPTASFVHPFVATGSWDNGNGWNSRWAISRIYRWYKILSPTIQLDVKSVAFDRTSNVLYVGIAQVFRIFPFVPLGYKANVELVTRLSLHQAGDGKFYIQEQNDLYQTAEFAKFLWFGLWRVVMLWQFLSMLACILLAAVGWPVSIVEEQLQLGGDDQRSTSDDWVDTGFEEREKERRKLAHSNGHG